MIDDRSNIPEGWADLGAQWRAQPATTVAVEIADTRRRAHVFARKILLRNTREAIAALVVIVAGLHIAWDASHTLGRSSGVALAIGALFVLVVLLVRGGNQPAPPSDAPTSVALAHEHAELERQARLLERVWLWYLAPLAPGMCLVSADELRSAIERDDAFAIALSLGWSGLAIAAFVFVAWLNRRAARKLRERMAKLM